LINDKSFLAKSKWNLAFSEGKGNTLYNKRFPSSSYIKWELSKKLSERVLSIYSCGFCKDSGNYFKNRKFSNIKEAANYYNLSLKCIRSSIKAGSLPCNFKLNGLGLSTRFKGSVESIYFFELEKGRFGKPVICYTEADFFVGYFNSVSSAQSFLELDKKVILDGDCEDEKVLKRGLCFSKRHNLLVKLYKMNLDTSLSVSDIDLIEKGCEIRDNSTFFSLDVKSKKVLNRFSNVLSVCEFYGVSRSTVYRSISNKSVVRCSILLENNLLEIVEVIFFKQLR